eukprot:4579363-Pleurochrysis_carterae.AAC.1
MNGKDSMGSIQGGGTERRRRIRLQEASLCEGKALQRRGRRCLRRCHPVAPRSLLRSHAASPEKVNDGLTVTDLGSRDKTRSGTDRSET